MKKLLSILTVFMFTVSTFAQLNLKSDAAHSRIQFTVTHLGINDITGNFDKADLTIKADEKNFVNSKLTFSADVNSINTHIEARDNHLKSADFFDTAKYPSVKFDITKVEDLAAGTESKVAGANKTVSGNLTIKDKTVNVSFPAKVEVTENGLTMVSNFTINRQDWGLAYGTEGDPKDWMISQEVDLELNVVAGK